MLSKDVLDMQRVIEGLEDYNKHADGVVIGELGLYAVVDAIAKHESLSIQYLRVKRSGKLVQTDEGLVLIAGCLLESQNFINVRDFSFLPMISGGALFSFTATNPNSVKQDDSNYLFTTYNLNGYATFRIL